MMEMFATIYFLLGLFYAGKTFERICNFSIESGPVEKTPTKSEIGLVFVLTFLTILCYPFVIGIDLAENNLK